jgi:hypothetical protein
MVDRLETIAVTPASSPRPEQMARRRIAHHVLDFGAWADLY